MRLVNQTFDSLLAVTVTDCEAPALMTPTFCFLQLVLGAMQSHPSSLRVHLVATACIFNLTTQNMAEAMPVSLLSATVGRLLYAMKTFPSHQEVRVCFFSLI